MSKRVTYPRQLCLLPRDLDDQDKLTTLSQLKDKHRAGNKTGRVGSAGTVCNCRKALRSAQPEGDCEQTAPAGSSNTANSA